MKDFFLALDGDKYEQSFDAASSTFREGVTKAEWVDFQRKNRLKYGKPTDHRTKTVKTNTDLTTGKLTFVVPVASTFEKGEGTETVTVVRDPDGKYRVADYTFTVNYAASPAVALSAAAPASNSAPGLPSATVATLMVNNTMVNFKNAINSGNFEPFYGTQVSDRWKKETTPEKLKTIFKPFVDKKLDLSSIFLVDPVLDPAPSIISDGLLILEGHYPLPQQKVTVPFELAYSSEAKWGLSGINVKVNPIAP